MQPRTAVQLTVCVVLSLSTISLPLGLEVSSVWPITPISLVSSMQCFYGPSKVGARIKDGANICPENLTVITCPALILGPYLVTLVL